VNLTRALAAFEDLDLHVVTMDPGCSTATRSTWQGVTIHRLPFIGRRVLTGAIGPGRRQISQYLHTLAPLL
jgi:hypothetical protein